jgi:tetratricopeptide (TPR) repeat protein
MHNFDTLNKFLKDELSPTETYQQAASSLQAFIQRVGGTSCENSGTKGAWTKIIQRCITLMGAKVGLTALQSEKISNAVDYDQVRQEADLPSGTGLYQNASDFNTNSAEAYDSWGWALADNQQYEAAIEQFQKAIATEPDRIERFYHSWGLVLAAQGHYEEAIEKYQEVNNINQAYIDVYESWGWVLAKQEKYSQAIEQFQKAITAKPKNVERYYHCWGLILATQGQHEAAIEQYQKACDCNPKYTETYRSWGLALADLNRFDEAITKNPEYAADYCYRWGWVLTTQKRYKEAINLFEKAIHLSPCHETNDCLGFALDKPRGAVKAISTFKQAIELNQDDFPTNHTVSAALWYRQCYEKWQKNRFVFEQMH